MHIDAGVGHTDSESQIIFYSEKQVSPSRLACVMLGTLTFVFSLLHILTIISFRLFQQTVDAISKFEDKLKMILLPTDDGG